jgi:hypothetical protein
VDLLTIQGGRAENSGSAPGVITPVDLTIQDAVLKSQGFCFGNKDESLEFVVW